MAVLLRWRVAGCWMHVSDMLERLSPEARQQIAHEHPGWRLADGLCGQCLDLYEVNHVSHGYAS